ncbi:MAG: hypothetical protein U5K75_07250 [Ahrensia sp.]|nr:hypothetical protein [Ahrensia sp.]
MATSNFLKKTSSKITAGLIAVALIAGGTYFYQNTHFAMAMMHNNGGMQGMMGGMGNMHNMQGMMSGMNGGANHGADGTGHDEMTMPGLRGQNATAQESQELALMFRKFKTLSRTVENLPNGIRTVTTSSDEEVMASLSSHVTGMIGRVENLDDPKIMIQSPTLDIFFQRGEKIISEIDVTDKGIVVIQTIG